MSLERLDGNEQPYPHGSPRGQIRRTIMSLWLNRIEDAGSFKRFLEIWCPESPGSNRSTVVSVSHITSSHQTFRLGSLPSGEALMSLR